MDALEEESNAGGGDVVATAKEMCKQLESRVESRRAEQLELISSLQTLVPDLVSTLNLSLQIISSINHRPYTPISPPPTSNPNPNLPRPLKRPLPENLHNSSIESKPKALQSKSHPEAPASGAFAKTVRRVGDDDDEKVSVDEDRGSPLSMVRSMVAACLLERVPFTPIDSSTVLRKLENDQSATAAEKAALREVGGESGAILAVEMALRSMSEDNGGVELEEFVVSGKSRVMVMNIDRLRLAKELPRTARRQRQQLDLSWNGGKQSPARGGDEDVSGGGYGSGGRIHRSPAPEVWSVASGDPHLSSMPPLFPGSIGPGPMLGQRGSGPRGTGMMPMARGMSMPSPQHRPHFGQNSPNSTPVKHTSEEEVIKDLEALLNKKSFKEMQKSKTGEELMDLIHRPTAKETAVAAKFKTKGGSQLKEYCSALTKEDCRQKSGSFLACDKVHFRRIIALHTDINLGDCSFLDTCRHMKTCKYVHYELDPTPDVSPLMGPAALTLAKPLKPQRAEYCSEVELGESQWINCDIRNFRMDILGQFGVIMADPPWDIHMELPYGTMADDEMRTLNVPALQTDGLIFLWVTGRAMELGRECLELWGYKRVEEIIWVKTNQLQRIIRTGRTGHWLNHSKEHCLVGIKGNPEVNRNIDTDVVVAEVRETSRKPDEMYPLLERISPRTRKLELFARMHNTHAGWLSLGNQLNGVRLVDEGLRGRFRAAYPDVEIQPPSPPRSSAMEVDSSAGQTRAPYSEEFKSTPPQFSQPAVSQGVYISVDKPMVQDAEMVS